MSLQGIILALACRSESTAYTGASSSYLLSEYHLVAGYRSQYERLSGYRTGKDRKGVAANGYINKLLQIAYIGFRQLGLLALDELDSPADSLWRRYGYQVDRGMGACRPNDYIAIALVEVLDLLFESIAPFVVGCHYLFLAGFVLIDC